MSNLLLDLAVRVGLIDNATPKIGSVAAQSVSKLSSLAVASGNIISGIATKAAGVISSSMGSAVSRVDTLNQFPKVMKQMGFSADAARSSVSKLSDGIEGLPTSLDSITSNAQRIALLTGNLDTATDTALALNDAFLASGSSVADADRGLTQYVQMLSKGKVDMQSWRTLQETMGYALRETANAMGFDGVNAVNDLYDALQSGEVTFDEFNAKLVELDQGAGGLHETAKTASAGIETSMANAKTAVVKNLANMVDAVNGSGAISGFFDNVKNAVNVFGKAMTPAAEEAGRAFADINGKISEFVQTIGSADSLPSGFAEAVKNAFGVDLTGVMESAAGVAQKVKDGIDRVGDAFDNLSQKAGEDIATAGLDALAGALDVVGGLVELLSGALSFLTENLDVILPIAAGIAGAFGAFKVISEVVGLVVGLANVFGPLISVMGMAISSIAAGAPVFGTLAAAIGLVASPVGIAAAAIGIIIGIIVALATNAGGCRDIVTNAFQAMGDFISSLPGLIGGFLNDIISKVGAWASDMASRAAEAGSSFLGNVGSFIASVPGNVAGFLSEVISNVAQWAGEMGSGAMTAASDFASNLIDGIASLPGRVVEIGSQIISGLVNGITGAAGSVVSAISGVVGDAIGAAKSLLGIHSPSRVFREIGDYAMQGMELGVGDGEGGVSKSVKSAVGGAIKVANAMAEQAEPIELAATAKTQKVKGGEGEGYQRGKGRNEVIEWLAANLPRIIAECTPVMGEGDFGRKVRKAVAYA